MSEASLVEYPYSYSPIAEGPINEIRRRIMPFRFALAAREIASEIGLNDNSPKKVLEIGSGLGLLGQELVKRAKSVKVDYFGIDLVLSSLQKGKETIPRSLQADAKKLPFSDNSFDSVVSTDVLEHIPDATSVVREIRRVLKPGGVAFLVIADPSEGRFRNVSDHVDRTNSGSDISFWEDLFGRQGFTLRDSSKKYREKDWRNIFKLPFLAKLKDKPGFACAFNPVYRPGVYILENNK